MNRPPMEDDDGFGDFRAKVKGLPRKQRMAALKEMEDAVLENLRSNTLRDLYEDQPTPAPQGRQPPSYNTDPYEQDRDQQFGQPQGGGAYDMEENDARTRFEDENGYGDFEDGMVDAGNGDPSGDNSHINDAYWKQPGMEQKFQSSRKPAQGRRPPTGDSGLDASLGRVDPNSVDQDDPDYEAYMGEYEDELRDGGMTPENDPVRFKQAMQAAPRGYDKNRARPTPKSAGMDGGEFWRAAERAKLPTDNQTLNSIMEMVNQGMSPDEAARKVATSRPTPKKMGAIIDDEEPMAFDDVATPTKFQGKPPSGVENGDDGMMQERLRDSEGKIKRYMGNFQVGNVPDAEPPETEGYVVNPKWIEWSMKDSTPQELDAALQKAENDMRQAASEGYEGGDGYYGILTEVAVLRKMKEAMGRPKPPAPKAQGMFGRPPSVSRPMLEQ